MRKIFIAMFAVALLCGVASAQTFYSWRQRTHATDCTALTDGREADLCYEIDSQTLFKCVPSIGACDTPGEWKRIEAVESDPVVKAINGIVKSNGTTISAATAGTDYQAPLTADTHYLTPSTAASTYQPIGSYLTSESDPGVATHESTYNHANYNTAYGWGNHASAGYAPLVSPSFTTPTLGAASATSINKVAITAPATSATLTIANGKTLTVTNTVNLNTMTDGKWCRYSSSGTALNCNVDPVTDTNTTYTASGSLLQLSGTAFSLKEGTLTNGKFCTYSSTTGLVCTSDANNYTLPTATDSVLGGVKVGTGLSITDGVLSATGGGYTNLTSFVDQTAWRLFYSDGSGDVKDLALGSDGEFLKSNGATSVPSWGTPTGGAHDAVTLAGQDYLSLSTQQITANLIKGSNINWDTIENIASANINWSNIETISPITEAMIGDLGSYLTGNQTITLSGDVTGSGATTITASINWSNIIDLIGDTQINWTSVQGITGSNINWALIDEDVITGVNWADYGPGKRQICFIIDGGGSAVTTGAKAWVRAPNAFTIGGMEITADQSGSCVVDIWKDTYANFPPTVADTITASAKPTLSTAQKAQDTTLTGWTKTINAGDYLRANVDSCSTITMLEVCLYE